MAVSKLLTRNDLQNVLAHINLGDDAHMEITQAEFDALSQADKDDGTIYFITDGISKNIFLDDNTPVGAIMPYGGDNDPAYWLICDGRAVSRTAYAELFAVIGTTYGTGDGSTTFNIPDLRGRVTVGHNTTYGLGASGGEATHVHSTANHTLTVNEMPNHNHARGRATLVWGQLSEMNGTISAAQMISAGGTATSGGFYTDRFADASVTRSGATGGGAGHNHGNTGSSSNMQPYLVTNYIIKVASSASKDQSHFDLFYPVGSYYETTDSTFNPAERWGGVWERNIRYFFTDYSTTTPSEIITAGTNVNITNAYLKCRQGIAQLFITWTNKVAISVGPDGNASNILVGSLLQNVRPGTTATATSYGDLGGPAFYYLFTDGTVGMGAAGGTGASRTIAAGTTFHLGTTYVLQDSATSMYFWHRIA